MNAMTSMALTPAEQDGFAMPIPMPDKPRFPYGLRISLTEADLKKLGLDVGGAEADGMVELICNARITSISVDPVRVELQIEEMCICSEEEPEPKPGFRDRAKVLYDNASRMNGEDDED